MLIKEIKQVNWLLRKTETNNNYWKKSFITQNSVKIKILGPGKCVATSKILFIKKNLKISNRKIRQLKRNTYYVANPKIVLRRTTITPGGNDQKFNFYKSMVIYKLSCCCKLNYIRLTTKYLRKNIKEHTVNSVHNFFLLKERKII